MRLHYHEINKLSKKWKDYGSLLRLKQSDIPCKITVISGRKRIIDPDNVCCKFVIDAIKGKVIPDDSAKYIAELSVQQVKSKEPYTEIIVNPV